MTLEKKYVEIIGITSCAPDYENMIDITTSAKNAPYFIVPTSGHVFCNTISVSAANHYFNIQVTDVDGSNWFTVSTFLEEFKTSMTVPVRKNAVIRLYTENETAKLLFVPNKQHIFDV